MFSLNSELLATNLEFSHHLPLHAASFQFLSTLSFNFPTMFDFRTAAVSISFLLLRNRTANPEAEGGERAAQVREPRPHPRRRQAHGRRIRAQDFIDVVVVW